MADAADDDCYTLFDGECITWCCPLHGSCGHSASARRDTPSGRVICGDCLYGVEKPSVKEQSALDLAIVTLEKVRQELCCYAGLTCDCKYGLIVNNQPNGERTGCPEVRDVIRLLRELQKKKEEQASG